MNFKEFSDILRNYTRLCKKLYEYIYIVLVKNRTHKGNSGLFKDQ